MDITENNCILIINEYDKLVRHKKYNCNVVIDLYYNCIKLKPNIYLKDLIDIDKFSIYCTLPSQR